MKTFKDFINEDLPSNNNERIESLRKVIKSIGYVTGISVDEKYNFYYVNSKKDKYIARFKLNDLAFKKDNKHKIDAVTIYCNARMIYELVWVKQFFDVVEYFSKASTLFDNKVDNIISNNSPDEWETAIKKLDKDFIVSQDEMMGIHQIKVTKKSDDPYHKIRMPFFGYEVRNVSKLMGVKNLKVHKKFFGFYDDKGYKVELDYSEIKKSIDAFVSFKKIIEKIGY